MDKFSRKEIEKSKVLVTMTTDIQGLASLLKDASNGIIEHAKSIEELDPDDFNPEDYYIELLFAVRENPEDLWGEKRHEIMGFKQMIIIKKEDWFEDN